MSESRGLAGEKPACQVSNINICKYISVCFFLARYSILFCNMVIFDAQAQKYRATAFYSISNYIKQTNNIQFKAAKIQEESYVFQIYLGLKCLDKVLGRSIL